MWDLVGNPEDRFSHNEAHLFSTAIRITIPPSTPKWETIKITNRHNTKTGVGSSPALATCETSEVLLAGVSGGFPGVLPFRPTYRLTRLDMSEIILKGTVKKNKKKQLYSPKVLVIPRKRWLRPDMTEKILTGALSLNTNKQITVTSSITNVDQC